MHQMLKPFLWHCDDRITSFLLTRQLRTQAAGDKHTVAERERERDVNCQHRDSPWLHFHFCLKMGKVASEEPRFQRITLCGEWAIHQSGLMLHRDQWEFGSFQLLTWKVIIERCLAKMVAAVLVHPPQGWTSCYRCWGVYVFTTVCLSHFYAEKYLNVPKNLLNSELLSWRVMSMSVTVCEIKLTGVGQTADET